MAARQGMNRRKAIITLATLPVLAVGPLRSLAQLRQSPLRVACLSTGPVGAQGNLRKRLEPGLATAGLPAGELRFFLAASDDFDEMSRGAAEAAAWAPDAILAPGPLHAAAARGATRAIPTVFFAVPDPEEFLLIEAHARPGANAEGSAANSAA